MDNFPMTQPPITTDTNNPADNEIPLCVDLDGTLTLGDLTLESVLALLVRNPLYIVLLLYWLVQGGRVRLKTEIARLGVTLDVVHQPWHQEFMSWLQTERQRGRPLWLCTASHASLARPVVKHWGDLFDGFIATEQGPNLSGRTKAERLAAVFGLRGFDYCGNSRADLAVWRVSRQAVVVGNEGLTRKAAQCCPIKKSFAVPELSVGVWLRALRVYQWPKNLLVFAPILAAHRLAETPTLLSASLAFLAFSLCASSVYLLNDALDLSADRRHAHKRHRPLPSGVLQLRPALAMAFLLLLGAFVLCLVLPFAFGVVLAIYYGLTCLYSFMLKRLAPIDVLMLAGLYTLRIVAGGEATAITLSFWMLLFAVFLFYSLALLKRYVELQALRGQANQDKSNVAGRDYRVDDLPWLHTLGIVSGCLAVLVLALYINSGMVLEMYSEPRWIWALPVLTLYWISRVWLLARRGQMNEDPVLFALRDHQSLALLAVVATIVYLSI